MATADEEADGLGDGPDCREDGLFIKGILISIATFKGEKTRKARTCGMMQTRVAMLQRPVLRIEATKPMMATERANWMMRRASLESHMPAGETWGGGGFGGVWSVILVKRKRVVSRRSTMRV